ncbi:myotubularin-related 13 isoform X5, partial [Brachionus plicatilis]
MTRLVDYFAVVGYEATSAVSADSDLGADGRAKIIQRFPLDDQHLQLASQFDANIQCFCQPHKGWHLTGRQQAPTYLVSVLTDATGHRKYLACLTFLEPYSTGDPNGDQDGEGPISPSRLYAAKSLVVVSRLDYAELFKSLLSLVYACYVDKRDSGDNKLLEQMIGRLLAVQVGVPGSALCSHFSLGADDKHMVQAEASVNVASTGTSVYGLLRDVGVANLINLVCAILADFKVLFFSRSYGKLYEACRALDSLLFPLKYTGVYVPVLPCFGSFLEFPAAPTPYIIGVHSSCRLLLEQMHHESLGECVKVDLDSGAVHTPAAVADLIEPSATAGLPVHLHQSTLNLLYWIVKRDVLHADELNTGQGQTPPFNDHVHADKLIRAVFVRLFAQLFAGYRYCLLVVRINPRPVICFDKASFLSSHDLLDNEFMNKVLDSMSFERFIEERAPSYRRCDLFDELYACVQADLCAELAAHDTDLHATNGSYYSSSSSLIYTHVNRVGDQLLKCEFPCYKRANDTVTAALYPHLVSSAVRSHSKFKPATVDAYKRVHSEPFPLLDAALVLKHAKQRAHHLHHDADSARTASKCSVVPYGPPIQTVHNICLINKRLADIEHKISLVNGSDVHDDCVSRKLHTVRTFIGHVFDKNFKEAKKHVNSTMRAIRSHHHARIHLCATLQAYANKNHVILDNEQFEYVCELLNEALHSDTRHVHIAYLVLPLSAAFYRKLNNNTIDQCVYTRIQHHDVWSNMSFWQMAFYTDVQRSIRPVYLSNEEFAAEQAE